MTRDEVQNYITTLARGALAQADLPKDDAEWFARQQAQYALERQTAEEEQRRIDEYNRYNKPLFGISRLGGADHTELDNRNKNMSDIEHRVIGDVREQNRQNHLANEKEFMAVVNALVQEEAERANARLPAGTQAIANETIRNALFPGYKPGNNYSAHDYARLLVEANVPEEYVQAFKSKYIPDIDEKERLAQLYSGKPSTAGSSEVLQQLSGALPEEATPATPPVQLAPAETPAPETPVQPPVQTTVQVTPAPVNVLGESVGNTVLHTLPGVYMKALSDAEKEAQPAGKDGRRADATTPELLKRPAEKATKQGSTEKTNNYPTTVKVAPAALQALAGTATPAVSIGSRGSYIPSTGFTTPDNAGGAPITISPVEFGGDNGGLQYGAMNALYTDPHRAPSLGELLAFSSIMQGKKDLGGIADVTATMQNADKMNAYAAQQNIAPRMQQLMASGASADEARYQAITEEMLRSGQGRSAAAITMPEYAKAADMQAARTLDALAAAGGDYEARRAFGYTPLGVGAMTTNSDGSYNMNIGGKSVTGIAPEYARMSVYSAIKGDGSGSKLANDYDLKFNEKQYASAIDAAKSETEAAKILYELTKRSTEMTPEQKLEYMMRVAEAREAGKLRAKTAQAPQTPGNTTGIDPKWF
jgi:hypothetical protein